LRCSTSTPLGCPVEPDVRWHTPSSTPQRGDPVRVGQVRTRITVHCGLTAGSRNTSTAPHPGGGTRSGRLAGPGPPAGTPHPPSTPRDGHHHLHRARNASATTRSGPTPRATRCRREPVSPRVTRRSSGHCPEHQRRRVRVRRTWASNSSGNVTAGNVVGRVVPSLQHLRPSGRSAAAGRPASGFGSAAIPSSNTARCPSSARSWVRSNSVEFVVERDHQLLAGATMTASG